MNKMIESTKTLNEFCDKFRSKDGKLYCFKDDGTIKSIIPKKFKTKSIEREVQDDLELRSKWHDLLLNFPPNFNIPRDVHKELEQIQRETKESSYLVCKNYLKNLNKKTKIEHG